jgi:hypothetical protein
VNWAYELATNTEGTVDKEDIGRVIAKEMKKSDNEIEFLITSPYNDMITTTTTTTTTTTAGNDTPMHSLSEDELDGVIADSTTPFRISGTQFEILNSFARDSKFRIRLNSFYFIATEIRLLENQAAEALEEVTQKKKKQQAAKRKSRKISSTPPSTPTTTTTTTPKSPRKPPTKKSIITSSPMSISTPPTSPLFSSSRFKEEEFEEMKAELKELRAKEKDAQVEAALLKGQLEQMKERLAEKDKEIIWLRQKIN